MLLKLLMPSHHWIVGGGVIVNWHKAPGELVDYGDDLLDIRIEEGVVTQAVTGGWSEKDVRALIRAQMTREGTSDRELLLGRGGPPQASCSVPVLVHLRISSSDRGVMRQRRAEEGERRQTGDLLAILTTDEDESIAGGADELAQASPFRVVVTPLPEVGPSV